MNAAGLQRILAGRPFVAGAAIGLLPSMDFAFFWGVVFNFDETTGEALGSSVVLFVMLWPLYGVFLSMLIRLSLQLEGQFIGVREPPSDKLVRYRKVRNKVFLVSVVLSYAIMLVGHAIEIGFAAFGWALPALVATAAALLTPPAWALLRGRVLEGHP